MKLPDGWSGRTPVFDDEHLVSCAGLVPVMALGRADRAVGADRRAGPVQGASRVASAGVNPAGKLTSIIAGMAAGADSIDDLDVIRSGGMQRLFGEVYAPATLGQFLREFTHGHTLQLAVGAAGASGEPGRSAPSCCPGSSSRRSSTSTRCCGRCSATPSRAPATGTPRSPGKQVLRKGLSPLATTITTRDRGAGDRRDPAPRREGRLGQGRGVDGHRGDRHRPGRRRDREILVRGDSAYGNSAVVGACLQGRGPVLGGAGQEPGRDPGDRHHPRGRLDAGALPRRGARPRHRGADLRRRGRRDAAFTAFASTQHPVTARLIVRRVRDRAKLEELFPVWRHHPFFTNSPSRPPTADITHRRHAIIETVFADLIDGPLAHLPSGRFAANSAWAICAAITHNLLRAAGTLAGPGQAVARGATLRRQIVTRPRPDRPTATPPVLHLPAHWPWAEPLAHPVGPRLRTTRPAPPAPPDPSTRRDRPEPRDPNVETLGRPAAPAHAHHPHHDQLQESRPATEPIHGSRLSADGAAQVEGGVREIRMVRAAGSAGVIPIRTIPEWAALDAVLADASALTVNGPFATVLGCSRVSLLVAGVGGFQPAQQRGV